MNITINTSVGTFVVPSEKESSLIMWLQQNAASTNQQGLVREHQKDFQSGLQTYLINENFKGEF